MGVTAESAVTPTVIVALSAHHALNPAVIDSDSRDIIAYVTYYIVGYVGYYFPGDSKQSLQEEERP